MKKHCPGCNEDKEIELFAKNKCRKDGRQPHCRACFARHHKAKKEKQVVETIPPAQVTNWMGEDGTVQS